MKSEAGLGALRGEVCSVLALFSPKRTEDVKVSGSSETYWTELPKA